MTKRFLLLSSSLLALALASGCSKKDTQQSNDLTTHAMSMDFSVYANGASAQVTVTLHGGDFDSNESVHLASGDNLVLRVGAASYPLQEHDDDTVGGTVVRYGTSLAGVTDGTFIVDFTRTSGASALGNTLTLPPAFTLTAPTATVSRKSPMTITWDSPGNGYNVEVDFDGNCIEHDVQSVVGEPGSLTINGGELKALAGHEGDTCPVTITVMRRIQTGSGFSSEFGYKRGSDAQQTRTATIQSGP